VVFNSALVSTARIIEKLKAKVEQWKKVRLLLGGLFILGKKMGMKSGIA
jgi:hypothetical protein